MTRARLVRKRDEHSARSLARWSSALHANEENGCAGRTDRRTGEMQKCRGGNCGWAWKGSSSLDDGGAHRQRVKSSQGNGTEGRLHLLNRTQTCTHSLPVPLSVPLRLSISRLPAAFSLRGHYGRATSPLDFSYSRYPSLSPALCIYNF